jgi:hypothetical protein
VIYDKLCGKCCLITTDHEDKKVIFTERQRLLKSDKHPELRSPDFINGRVKDAIKNPDFIYQDLGRPEERIAVYKLEFKINERNKYTKIVMNTRPNSYFIITAFRPENVKERGKTKLLYGKDN